MTERNGIGEDGKTLVDMMEESRRLFEETECYAGITEPRLLRDDPIKGELFHSRILASMIAGREVTRMISGSPFVNEIAELCIGLYTPEGDNFAQSSGIQTHIRPMGDVIKWMIANHYEEEVGIHDGDIFCSNDPYIGGVHPADVYDIMPIFWEKELVAWVSTVIMEMDIGAVGPYCVSMPNVERASDGLRFCAEKTGFNDRLRRDFEHKIELSLDMPDMFLLDRKGAVAADIRIREDIKDVIREFGRDYFKTAIRELVEEERRNQVARIRQRTVPGRYRNVVPVEFYLSQQPVAWLPGKRDTITLVPIQMDILSSGQLILDFEGTGQWGWHPCNCNPSALWGGLSTTMAQTLAIEGRANLGTLLPCDIRAPQDSLVNPSQYRLLANSSAWATLLDVASLWLGMLGTAYYLRGFREETVSFRSMGGWQMGGYDQHGIKRPIMWGTTGNFGPGARGVADGIDVGGCVITPEVDMGNAEIWELFIPYFEMSRKLDPYTQGYGRFRSGLAAHINSLIHGSTLVFASAIGGSGSRGIIPNLGLFGGYCGGKQNSILIRNTNVPELIEKRRPLFHETGHPASPEFRKLVAGEVYHSQLFAPPMELHDWDIVLSDFSGGGGLGDPIERDSALMKDDLDNGLATYDICRNIYCAEFAHDPTQEEWTIDREATAKLREAKRQERLARGVPVREWWNTQRRRIFDRDLDPKIIETYRSSIKMSQPFAQEFRDFWALPEDFSL